MKVATYYWFEGLLPIWLENLFLRLICARKGHDPSPGPVASCGSSEVYQCWRCYRTIQSPVRTEPTRSGNV